MIRDILEGFDSILGAKMTTTEDANCNGDASMEIDFANLDGIKKVAQQVQRLAGLDNDWRPRIGVICGSGLGPIADLLQNPRILPYTKIPGFTATTVPGHQGRLVFGELNGKPLACLQGRSHPYEGHSMQQCVFPVRVLWALGMESLIITNATGGLNPDFQSGDLMLIADHICLPLLNLQGPLIGHNDERVGPRFLSMNNVYDRSMREKAKEVGKQLGVRLQEGIYAMVSGPQFETPAELRMLRAFGVDAVGMSVCHEAVAAVHAGVKVLGISLITTNCQLSGDGPEPSDVHSEVLETGEQAVGVASRLISGIVSAI